MRNLKILTRPIMIYNPDELVRYMMCLLTIDLVISSNLTIVLGPPCLVPPHVIPNHHALQEDVDLGGIPEFQVPRPYEI